MDVEELREHYESLYNELDSRVPEDEQQDVWERHLEVWRELEERVSADYPECPTCDSTDWVFDQDGVPSCSECGEVPPREVSEQVSEESLRVLRGNSDAE